MRALRSWLTLLGAQALISLPAPAGAQPVGEEFQINTYTTGRQQLCSRSGGNLVAADASGNFVAVWFGDGQGDSNYGVFGQRYDSDGNARGAEFRVNSYTSQRQWRPAVAADASGDFVVVWSSEAPQDGSADGIFGQRYDGAGGALGSEFRVNSFTTGRQRYPSVAADADGNFVVVWQSMDQDGSDHGIFAQRYDSAGEALGSEFRVNSFTTNHQRFPSVAANAGGNFVVVWQSDGQDGSSHGIFGQRYDSAGGALGNEFRVNSFTTGSQLFPSVAAAAAGDFVVAWESASRVAGQRYDSAGDALGEEFTVGIAGFTPRPHAASDADGNFLIVWSTSPDHLASELAGRLFDNRGDARRDKFQVNSFTNYLQECGSVVATGTNRFVVAWESGGDQDGFSTGIFGRRLDFAEDLAELDGGFEDGN